MTLKLKLARSLMSNKEKQDGVQPLLSKNWEARKQAIADRVKRKQGEAHARAILRKENATKKPPTKKEVKEARKIIEKAEAKKKRHVKFINKRNK